MLSKSTMSQPSITPRGLLTQQRLVDVQQVPTRQGHSAPTPTPPFQTRKWSQ